MSMLNRLHDRMTGVLGHDCSGKPIRAGDLVEPAVPPEHVRDGFACVLTVTGISRHSIAKPGQLDVKNDAGAVALANPSDLRKIDEGLDSSWREVSQSTGWTPRIVRQDDEVPA